MRKIFKFIALAVALFLVAAQVIRPELTNPPVNPDSTFEAIARPKPAAASIMKRACYDCHSNNTVWPWYSRVAPISWLVADDVNEGRAKLNFSEWGLLGPEVSQKRLQAVCEEVKDGEMPLMQYLIIHSDARLTPEEVNTVCNATVPSAAADVRRGEFASQETRH
jgi:hypothetical protein